LILRAASTFAHCDVAGHWNVVGAVCVGKGSGDYLPGENSFEYSWCAGPAA
jgi:hypothetical protein